MCNFPNVSDNTNLFYELKKIFTMALQNILFCNELISYINNYLNIVIGDNNFNVEMDDHKCIIINVNDINFNENGYNIIYEMISRFCISSFYSNGILHQITTINKDISNNDYTENMLHNIFDVFVFKTDNNLYYKISFSNQ